MRIVYISNSIIPSKTANSVHVMKMCQAFADNGHEVILLAPNRHKEFIKNVDNLYEFYNVKNNFKIIFLNYSYIRYIGIIYYTMNVFKKLKILNPDLVYGRDLYSCFLSSFKYDTVYEIHAPMNNNIKRMILDTMNQNSNYKKNIVISKVLKNIILKSQNINEKNIYVAHDGSDKVFDFDIKIDSIKNNGKLNIGYVGSLYKGKGVEIIIEISSFLPNVIFHIVGGKEEDIIYWKKNIFAKNIIFYGFVNQKDLSKYINSFDICLLPNQKNVYIENKINKNSNIGEYTSPLKMFEYMAHKKPIIASNLDVLKEVLNNKNSILVKYDNNKEWINAINKLNDKNLRKILAKSAYNDFIKNYTWLIRAKNIIRSLQNDIKK